MHLSEASLLFFGFLIFGTYVTDILKTLIEVQTQSTQRKPLVLSLHEPALPRTPRSALLSLPSIASHCQTWDVSFVLKSALDHLDQMLLLSSLLPKAAEYCWRGLGSPGSDFIVTGHDTVVVQQQLIHWANTKLWSCLPIAKWAWGAKHPAGMEQVKGWKAGGLERNDLGQPPKV